MVLALVPRCHLRVGMAGGAGAVVAIAAAAECRLNTSAAEIPGLLMKDK
jgi:hypothetical protein